MSSVDIIVPCYRYGHYLKDCVASVLLQANVNVRILIIDDASPDNTAEVAANLVKEDSRVVFRRHKVNQGHIATYNEGIEWASADYLLLLSADDYLLPGALSRATNLMDNHPEVGFTFGKAITYNDGDILDLTSIRMDVEKWHVFKGLDFIKLSGANNIVPAPTPVVRTELQKKLGGYRVELPHSADMEMWLRFAAHGHVGKTEAYQAVYRRHSNNMSLEYMEKTWLPDLQQRRQALEVFFQNYHHILPNAHQLQNKFLYLLACQAIGFASELFNENKMEASKSISEFALHLCPEVKRSLPWAKLFCKRSMGYGVWNNMQSVITKIRN
ncbi:MAG: glycosyltransferase family 2 protein [Methylobacter sp.]|nr:glycosyltransferase family 2 protein [Methylobacter sp.]